MSQNLRHFTAINAEDYHYSLATIPPKISQSPTTPPQQNYSLNLIFKTEIEAIVSNEISALQCIKHLFCCQFAFYAKKHIKIFGSYIYIRTIFNI